MIFRPAVVHGQHGEGEAEATVGLAPTRLLFAVAAAAILIALLVDLIASPLTR
jgi:hypothetical protein